MYHFIYQCIYQNRNTIFSAVCMAVKLGSSGGSQAKGFRQQGVAEDMLALERRGNRRGDNTT
jgi:hypothetical protein